MHSRIKDPRQLHRITLLSYLSKLKVDLKALKSHAPKQGIPFLLRKDFRFKKDASINSLFILGRTALWEEFANTSHWLTVPIVQKVAWGNCVYLSTKDSFQIQVQKGKMTTQELKQAFSANNVLTAYRWELAANMISKE